jgi:phosphoesterase RecJ-like protein
MGQRTRPPGELLELLARARRLLVGTGRLEGDALGAAVALHLGFTRLGLDCALCLPGPVPESLDFLPVRPEADGRATEPPDLGLVVEDEGCGPEFPIRSTSCPVLALSRSPCGPLPGWRNPAAAALGEMVYDLLETLQVPLDRDLALALYTSIFVGSDSFRSARVTPDTHLRVARLLEFEVPTDRIGRRVMRQKDFDDLKLLGQVLARLEVLGDGQLVWSVLDAEADPGELSLLLDYLSQVRGAQVTALAQPLPDGRARLYLPQGSALVGLELGPGPCPTALVPSLAEGRRALVEAVSRLDPAAAG